MLTPAKREAAVRHSERFRKVSTRYPLRVTEAYDGDIVAADADSDEQVAAKVKAWEQAHGVEPRDWQAIGAYERDEGPEPIVDGRPLDAEEG